ncbi:hypothetical protein Pint_13142 [Pistacia integerrima]|uniref:Uncharacterized protein n=1 Tax=Pistacia integerrima TaxID=434235 RepID=A0ACC0YAJ5_9ROSI|nr:hypothetical protein Pint_13142 [Pistacia integerrima]
MRAETISSDLFMVSEPWVVRTTLRAKKKYGFIDGTVKQPEDNSLELEDWWTVNSMLVSWVFNTIEPTIHLMISYMENVKDLWEDIRHRFSIGNGPRVQQLRFDLANCKQDGHAVITYYGRLEALWDELNNYDQIPVCTCTGCKCNLTAELERKREEERVHQFLMGLDEEGYGTERVRTITRTREERSSPMSFAVQTGYPEWWGNRPCTSVTGRCGGRKRGTGSSRNKPRIPQANATQASGVDGGLLSSNKNSGNERLTSKGRLLSWIIDSGAFHHMTRTYSCLSEVRDIVSCSVGLPNGEETMALKEGTMFLGEALILRHDRTSRKLIGAGERCEEVYFFKGVASAHACKAKGVGSSELWHMRMGHPSFKHISDNDVAKNVEENWNQEVDAHKQHVQDAKENGEVNHDEEEAPIADTSAVEGNIVEENENVEEPLGRGQRVKQPSVHLIL